jgi:hypothetical protein
MDEKETMKNYLVEFRPEGEITPLFETVFAESMDEAIYSIRVGWPDCQILNVYLDLDYSEDEDNNRE